MASKKGASGALFVSGLVQNFVTAVTQAVFYYHLFLALGGACSAGRAGDGADARAFAGGVGVADDGADRTADDGAAGRAADGLLAHLRGDLLAFRQVLVVTRHVHASGIDDHVAVAVGATGDGECDGENQKRAGSFHVTAPRSRPEECKTSVQPNPANTTGGQRRRNNEITGAVCPGFSGPGSRPQTERWYLEGRGFRRDERPGETSVTSRNGP